MMSAVLTRQTPNVANPFALSGQNNIPRNVLAESDQQREIAEIQAALIIAKRFQRNEREAMDRILRACTRPGLAEGALYSYSRGGSAITGPSIRLAEVAAQCWGNIQFGIRELEQRNGESTMQAYAWDLETNTKQEKKFQVSHLRHTKKGRYTLEDPRDIYELTANQGARRLRACILSIIPGDVIEAAIQQCEQTLKTTADTGPEAIKKMLAAFEKFHVSKAQIEQRIQCRIEAIRPAQMIQLKKIYASLRDGMSEVNDWFEVIKTPVLNEPKPLPDYPVERFAADLEKWKNDSKAGVIHPEQLIAMLSSKYHLTDEQKAQILALDNPPNNPSDSSNTPFETVGE